MVPVKTVPNLQSIIKLLRENGTTISDNVEFSFSRIGVGKGFASLLYKVRIDAHSYVVKITNPRASLEGFGDIGPSYANVHNREVDFYRWVSNVSEIARTQMRIPKFYGGCYCIGEEEGLLIIEDFSDRMVHEIDFKSGFSIKLVKEIIQAIASYQSVHLSEETKFPLSDKKPIYDSLAIIYKSCIDRLPKKKLHHYAEDIQKWTEEYPEFAKNATRAPIHCDLWPNNMIYEQEEEGFRLIAIIDWQRVCVGNALFDVAALCSICLTTEVRKEYEKELVEFYWTEMKKECTQLGVIFNMDLQTAHKLYRQCLQWSALLITTMMTFLKKEDEVEEKDKDLLLSERLKVLLEDVTEL